MRPSLQRVLVAGVLIQLLLVPPGVAQPICPAPSGPFNDNRDGYLVQFEEAPIHPMELSSDRSELWAANLADARVSVFDVSNPSAPDSPSLAAEIAVGLGPVTIRRRPKQTVVVEPGEILPFGLVSETEPLPTVTVKEMWVVCQSSNSVFIIDEPTRRVVDVVRVAHEPSDLVFNDLGTKAFVTLSASNQIAIINANTRKVTDRIEFQSELPLGSGISIHAEEPTSLLFEDGELLVLSNLSGNGTTFDELDLNTTQEPELILNLWNIYNSAPGLPEPPDRDIFRFDVSDPTADGTVVGWRFGTLNFDLERDPLGELVVSNMDMANDVLPGEFLYKEARFAQHRISTWVEDTSATSNTSIQHFDLNDSANVDAALHAQGYSCSMPTEMAWGADGNRLYVACYGTHNVAVVDYPMTTVLAELRSGATATSRIGFGPRGLVLDEERDRVYVHNRGDHTLQVYAANPAPGTVNGPLKTVPIGFDITPANIEAGRFHFTNAKNSTFGTESCNTCHVDAHFDGVAWDLSDFTGDLPTQPVGRDVKLLKVTMSLRGIEETPPFHWRGDRADLKSFAPAFAGLLGGTEPGERELQEIDDFIFSISYRPNPGQRFDRAYTPTAIDGLGCFTFQPAHDVSTDTLGATMDTTCEDCHGMAGFSATNNQINNDVGPPPSGNPPFGLLAEDATQLRGLFDKESDTVFYGGYGVPALGWGFANPGFVDTVANFVDLGVFDLLTQPEKDQIKVFLEEFDSGMARTTAYAFTIHKTSQTPLPARVTAILAGAAAGDNDVVARGWIDIGAGKRPIGMLYDAGTGQFTTDTTQPAPIGPFTVAQLQSTAAAGNGVFTLIGTPVGMGYRLGLDREMDYLLDGDEAFYGTSLKLADSDGDQYPDGYEVRLGSDPAAPGSVPPSETTPPTIVSPQVAWMNSNVVKVRWSTDEESKSRILIQDLGGLTLQSFEERQFKTDHVLVGRGLKPGQSYVVVIESEDPANPGGIGNQAQLALPAINMQPRLFTNALHVATSTLSVTGTITPGQPVPLTATFKVVDQDGLPLQGRSIDFDILEWIPGSGNPITPVPQTTGATDAQGVGSFSFSSTLVAGSGGVVEVISRQVNDPITNRLLFLPESGQFGFWAQLDLP